MGQARARAEDLKTNAHKEYQQALKAESDSGGKSKAGGKAADRAERGSLEAGPSAAERGHEGGHSPKMTTAAKRSANNMYCALPP